MSAAARPLDILSYPLHNHQVFSPFPPAYSGYTFDVWEKVVICCDLCACKKLQASFLLNICMAHHLNAGKVSSQKDRNFDSDLPTFCTYISNWAHMQTQDCIQLALVNCYVHLPVCFTSPYKTGQFFLSRVKEADHIWWNFLWFRHSQWQHVWACREQLISILEA